MNYKQLFEAQQAERRAFIAGANVVFKSKKQWEHQEETD